MSPSRWRDDGGELIAELAIVAPIIMFIGVITLNALGFIAECAKFDRATSELVRYGVLHPHSDGAEPTNMLVGVMGYDGNPSDGNHVTVRIVDHRGIGGMYLKRVEAVLYYKPWPAPNAVFFEGMPMEFRVPQAFFQHRQAYVFDGFTPSIFFSRRNK